LPDWHRRYRVPRGTSPSRTDPSGRPRVSVICTGRNDDRAPDQFERLISVQRTLEHALRKVPFEFLFIEWNPDPDRPYLGEALYLEQARHFVVTREAHKALIANAQMSTRDGKAVKSELAFLLNHANNVGLKYACGEWVLITNLDDLFPPQFGALFENGESSALALGVHPRWSYNLLINYQRAQRTFIWRRSKGVLRRSKRALARILRMCKSVLRIAISPFGSVKRATSHIVGPRMHLIRRLNPDNHSRPSNDLRVPQDLHVPVIQLPGGLPELDKQRVPLWRRLASTLAAQRKSFRRRLFLGRLAIRHLGRIIAKSVDDFFFAPRINWNVGRVRLTPGTLYRVRRQEVRDAFAYRGARASSIEQLVAELEADARPGPWNNDFPWTWASGDFMLLDYATWKRIGGYPQQIGQLHADSVTIFRLVAEGCRVALLDWDIYHMDHDNRFDAVPYVEYDFESVRRYFGPGWTNAEAIYIERTERGVFGNAQALIHPSLE
jgi:hypothetical protein